MPVALLYSHKRFSKSCQLFALLFGKCCVSARLGLAAGLGLSTACAEPALQYQRGPTASHIAWVKHGRHWPTGTRSLVGTSTSAGACPAHGQHAHAPWTKNAAPSFDGDKACLANLDIVAVLPHVFDNAEEHGAGAARTGRPNRIFAKPLVEECSSVPWGYSRTGPFVS